MGNLTCVKTSLNFKCFLIQHPPTIFEIAYSIRDTVSLTRIYELKIQKTDNEDLSKINIEMLFKLLPNYTEKTSYLLVNVNQRKNIQALPLTRWILLKIYDEYFKS